MKDELSKYSEVIEHAELKNYNTYHINGKAKYLVLPNSVQDLEKIIKYLNEKNIKYIVLGNGSNIVLNDREYDGVMIKLSKLDGIEVYPDKEMAYAEAGAMVPKLVQLAVDNSMTGLEFAAGIPGTVGGAIYGNAGAYNACFLDYVTSVTCLDKETYDIVTLEHEEFTYSYRTSSFKEEHAMKAFSDKWDEMIDNMILKLIISQYMQKAWDNVMKTLNDKEEEFLLNH